MVVEEKPAPVAPAAPVSSGLKLAFWWERFVAWLIDVILIAVVFGIITLFTFLAGLGKRSCFRWIACWVGYCTKEGDREYSTTSQKP